MFLAHTGFVAEHPGVPRLLFGELQRAGSTAPKRVAARCCAQYAERLRRQLEQGREQREFDPASTWPPPPRSSSAAIQGLVMQALIAGDVQRIRATRRACFAIYLRGIRARTAS
jgi:TetR/AcrR family transcriptional regulator